jgi:hypothetical protein
MPPLSTIVMNRDGIVGSTPARHYIIDGSSEVVGSTPPRHYKLVASVGISKNENESW